MNGREPQEGRARYRIILDPQEMASNPELFEWAAGPLAVAIAQAPFSVSILIARVDDPM
jgi:hypothetical protein